MPQSLSNQDRAGLFGQDVECAVGNIRQTFGAILTALPSYPDRAPDLARMLGIDRNLAWKVFRTVHERDIFTAAQLVPGTAAIDSFLTAASKHVPAALVREAREAAKQLNQIMTIHASDRASFEMMLSCHTASGPDPTEQAIRRAGFRASSFLQGYQARAQLNALFLHPGADDHTIDIASVKGLLDLRRVRPGAACALLQMHGTDDSGRITEHSRIEPIDPPIATADGNGKVPLVEPFCSQPLPMFQRVEGLHGQYEYELVEGPVGRTGEITCIFGEVSRGLVRRYSQPGNEIAGHVAMLRTPCEVVVFDVIAHESLFGAVMPRAVLYSDFTGSSLYRGQNRSRYRLPLHEQVEHLGCGAAVLQTPDIPFYPRLAQHIFDRLNWDSRRFHAYRMRLEFPLLPTSLVLEYPLPTKPEA